MDSKSHCKVASRSYVESHQDTTKTNNTNPRTHKFISLIPKGNIQGTQKFFFLNIGRVLPKRDIILMVAPDQVIIKVNDCCKNSIIEKCGIELCLLKIN